MSSRDGEESFVATVPPHNRYSYVPGETRAWEIPLNVIAFFVLAIYFIYGTISFFTFVEPSLSGANGWRAYGDSDVYMDTADLIRERGQAGAIVAFVSVARNVILPALVGLALRTAPNIAAFNIFLFFAALFILGKTYPKFRWYIFLPIVLASGTTYEAIFTLNKEIFVLLSAVMIARWFKTNSTTLILFLIALSAILRWEQAFVILVFLIFFRLKTSVRRASIILILGISIAYPIAMSRVLADTPSTLQDKSSSELYQYLDTLQGYGLYAVVLLPKVIIALLSQLIRFWQPFVDETRIHDLNNGLFVMLDQLCLCFVVFLTWTKKLWKTSSPVVLFVVVYLLIFLAAPMNQPRYLYMLLILMAVNLASPEISSLRIQQRQSSKAKRRSLAFLGSGVAAPSKAGS